MVSLGTTKALRPDLAPLALFVTAKTKRKSAIPPLVMNRFSPLRTKSEFDLFAWVFIEAASVPASGSVRARVPIFCPYRTGMRKSFFWVLLAK